MNDVGILLSVLHDVIFWGSFLVVPFLAVLVWFRKRLPLIVFIPLIVLSIGFVWARFFEPQLILVEEHLVETDFEAKIAVIADVHLGAFKSEKFLARVVQDIRRQRDLDFVVVAGDFLYEAEQGTITKLFTPFKLIEVPIYATLGNHDVIMRGPNLRQELTEVLSEYGITILENNAITHDDITIVGLGSRYLEEDDVGIFDSIDDEENVIVIAHNPDTTTLYTDAKADITISGHTHCGQIRIPGLYKQFIPTNGSFDKGWSQEKYTTLFITCGVGEVGLPMRLFNPPTIDVITFTKGTIEE